jgi:hypothetical protein
MSYHHNQTFPHPQLISIFIITLLLIYYPIRHTLRFAPAFSTLLSLPLAQSETPETFASGASE